jgi:sec-independent protein translocase protein TatA
MSRSHRGPLYDIVSAAAERANRWAARESFMVPLALFGSFGLQELLVILLIVVFLFGARKIPDIARGLGEGIRGFRASLKGEEEETDKNQEKNETSKSAGS